MDFAVFSLLMLLCLNTKERSQQLFQYSSDTAMSQPSAVGQCRREVCSLVSVMGCYLWFWSWLCFFTSELKYVKIWNCLNSIKKEFLTSIFPSLEWTNPRWLQGSGGKLPAPSYKPGQKKGRERSQAGFESLSIPSGWVYQRIYKERGTWAAQGIKVILLLVYGMMKHCCSLNMRGLCYLRNLFHGILYYLGNICRTHIMCVTSSDCWYTFLELFIF